MTAELQPEVRQRGRAELRRPLGTARARIAFKNAFSYLVTFLEAHVFAIERE